MHACIQCSPAYVAACCVLHDFHGKHGDDCNDDWMSTQEIEGLRIRLGTQMCHMEVQLPVG